MLPSVIGKSHHRANPHFCSLRDNEIKRHGYGLGKLSFNSGGPQWTDLGHPQRSPRIDIPYLLAKRRSDDSINLA